MGKHIIWQDFDINVEDYGDYLNEEHPEVTDENQKWELCSVLNESYLDDEKANLDIPVDTGIIVIGDLDLWNGRVNGIGNDELSNINEALVSRCSSMSYNRFYVDEAGNLRQDEAHHDGTNHYLFRKWRKGITEEQKDDLREAIVLSRSKKAAELMESYTESLGSDIEAAYGWAS